MRVLHSVQRNFGEEIGPAWQKKEGIETIAYPFIIAHDVCAICDDYVQNFDSENPFHATADFRGGKNYNNHHNNNNIILYSHVSDYIVATRG